MRKLKYSMIPQNKTYYRLRDTTRYCFALCKIPSQGIVNQFTAATLIFKKNKIILSTNSLHQEILHLLGAHQFCETVSPLGGLLKNPLPAAPKTVGKSKQLFS